jgi:hypothetical protein
MALDKRRLYVIAGDNSLVKVGVSISPATRLQDLQYDTDAKLELVWQSEPLLDCMKAESFVHKALEQSKHRGEWFHCTIEAAIKLCAEAVESDKAKEEDDRDCVRITISLTPEVSKRLSKLKAQLEAEAGRKLTMSAVCRLAVDCLAKSEGVAE